MTEQQVKDQILEEVGEGRLSYYEALEELEDGGIYVTPGYMSSLKAFSASAILAEAGFNRNGF